MFVSRSLSNPVPPTVITSTDGKLKAFVKKTGVLLRADFNGYHPDEVLRSNFYPDPQQKYGAGTFSALSVVGPGTLALDSTHVHSPGGQSLKFSERNTSVTTNHAQTPNPKGIGSNNGWASNNSSAYQRTIVTDVVRRAGTSSVKMQPIGTAIGGNGLLSGYAMGQQTTAPANYIPVLAGQTYTYSMYWASTAPNGRYYFTASYFDNTGTQIGATVQQAQQTTVNPANSFDRAVYTAVAPAGAVSVRIALTILGAAGYVTTAADAAWITDFQAEDGAAATRFIAGDLPSNSLYTYAWTGTASASASTRTQPASNEVARNLFPTPYWSGDSSPWSIYDSPGNTDTIGPGEVYQGRQTIKVEAGTGNARLSFRNALNSPQSPALPPGQYWITADLYLSANVVGNAFTIIARDDPNNDSGGGAISLYQHDGVNGNANIKGGWSRIACKIIVKPSRTVTSIYLTGATGAQPVGEFMEVGRIMISETTPDSTVPPATYIDGDMGNSGSTRYFWTGSELGSVSVQLTRTPAAIYSSGVSVGTAASLGAQVGDTIATSCWVYVPSSADPYSGQDICMGSYGGAFPSAVYGDAGPLRDVWQKVTVTNVVDDVSGSVAVRLYGPYYWGDDMWYGDFSIMVGNDTEDFNGDSGDGYRWAGTPGASTSQEFLPFVARSKDSIQGPLINTGGVITLGGVDITDELDFTFTGDTPADDWFTYDWQDDAETIALAQPQNPIEAIRVVRGQDLETGVLVRSGNDAVAPDGVAYAFDMEAPLGAPSLWRAYPVYADGTVGGPTTSIAIVAGEPTGFYDTWFKSVSSPELSQQVMLTKDNIPSFAHAARLNLQNPQGNPFPVGSRDVHTAATATLTAYTQTTDEQDAMEALLESGTLLFQTLVEYHLKDFYFEVGDYEMTLTGAGTALVARKWTIPISIVDRPTPLGAPLIVQGASYDDLPSETYDELGSDWLSYDSLLEGMIA